MLKLCYRLQQRSQPKNKTPQEKTKKDKQSLPWIETQTRVVQQIKQEVRQFPCLGILNPDAYPTMQTNASDIGFGGVLKQTIDGQTLIVRYFSGSWNDTQRNYSTVKKEILAIVSCVKKFQDDVVNTKFLLKVNCKVAKEILQKNIQNLVDDKLFYLFLTLILNLLNETKIPYQNFFHQNFCLCPTYSKPHTKPNTKSIKAQFEAAILFNRQFWSPRQVICLSLKNKRDCSA